MVIPKFSEKEFVYILRLRLLDCQERLNYAIRFQELVEKMISTVMASVIPKFKDLGYAESWSNSRTKFAPY
nr:unnamed protein product [Callosobruchus analis]